MDNRYLKQKETKYFTKQIQQQLKQCCSILHPDSLSHPTLRKVFSSIPFPSIPDSNDDDIYKTNVLQPDVKRE